MKLKAPPPMLRALPPAIAAPATGDDRDWRKWYKTARWQKLRWSVLVRDLFTCQMCGQIEGETERLVADHKVQHHGNAALFWDDANLQTLCKSPCHDKHKQIMERGGDPFGRGGGSKVGRTAAGLDRSCLTRR